MFYFLNKPEVYIEFNEISLNIELNKYVNWVFLKSHIKNFNQKILDIYNQRVTIEEFSYQHFTIDEYKKFKLDNNSILKYMYDYKNLDMHLICIMKNKSNITFPHQGNARKFFYTNDFIDCFSNVCDWDFINHNIKLPDYLVRRYFDKVKNYLMNHDYKHYDIIENIISVKGYYYLNNLWNEKQDIEIYKKYKNYISWFKILKYNYTDEEIQQLWLFGPKKIIIMMLQIPIDLILECLKNNIFINEISEYQNLNKEFIKLYKHKLNMKKIKKNFNIIL
jgi:hypothetical protein